jgi:PPOX class probable FMN-dependent enzyme
MSLAPWRSLLSRALHKNRSLPYARYFQLATVRADSRPANRTVVFRGFLEDTDQLKIITDSRSQKADQIDHLSWGEACWYFPNTREQFRFAGQLTLVGADYPDQTSKMLVRRLGKTFLTRLGYNLLGLTLAKLE